MKIRNQRGFAHPFIIVVLLLALIAAAGWYVWHRHQDNKPTAATSSSNVAVEPTGNYQLAVTQITADTGFKNYTAKGGDGKEFSIHLFTDKNACDDQAIVEPKNVKVGDEVLVKGQVNPVGYIEVCTAGSYLKLAQSFMAIKDWGIKVPTKGVAGISYTLGRSETRFGQVATFRSTALDNSAGKNCAGNSVFLARGTATQIMPNESGARSADNSYKAIFESNDNPGSVKAKIGGYYYLRPGYPGASCAGEDKVKQKAESQAIDAIYDALKKMAEL